MPKLTESAIEAMALELLQEQGYQTIYAPTIAPNGDSPERSSYSDVLLTARLKTAIQRLNPAIPTAAQADALSQIQRLAAAQLLTNNEQFHRYLTEGVPVSWVVDGDERGDLVWLVDFAAPHNNEFVAANQFTVRENNHTHRADLILFVNGMPLVVMELKNAAAETDTMRSAYQQLQTYKRFIPSLFIYNALLVISDGLTAKAGSLSAQENRFMAWKTADGKKEASAMVGQLQVLICGLLNKNTLLDLVRHFMVFETVQFPNLQSGVTATRVEKKIAAYHQYYAVNAAVASTLRAAAVSAQQSLPQTNETPESYNLPAVKTQPRGDKKAGVVWHTQGSGKSLSMVFYAGKIVLALDNPTLLVITDRNDLDDQLFATFAACKQLLRQEPQQAEDRAHLKTLLRVGSGGVIFTTMQKFQPQQGNVYERLSERGNIVVLADEAHRTQYGFAAKTLDVHDARGAVVGNKMVYGFAKYLRDALPHATYLGFTGTPIEKSDINTPAVFGNYVDVYDVAQAVADGATVRIYYASRLAKVGLSAEGKKLIAELDAQLEQDEALATQNAAAQKFKRKWSRMEALIGSPQRIKNVARDIVQHFEARQQMLGGKAMIVTMSRRIAVDLYEEIIRIRAQWHHAEWSKGAVKVVMTAAAGDGEKMAKHHTSKAKRGWLAERMKDDDDELKLVIVRDMWLTGFDVPSLHTLYIDKPMKGHNLMQAVARVNRVHPNKSGGLVVDYLGIAADLQQAFAFYADAGGKGAPALMLKEALANMLEKLEVVQQMYHGFPYQDYFSADTDTARKLSLILIAADHILGLENGKKRYADAVVALSHVFALVIPQPQAMEVRHEVAFFQAVKARLVKFENAEKGATATGEDLETSVRQVIDQALVSEKVVDVFDAAGIKKPDISVLSEEFLAELKNYPHKNIALEVLKKLLNDELRARFKTNLVKSKSLMKMLENAIQRYHNQIITATEVIDTLIDISKEIVASDQEAIAMNLSDFEYAFYTAVANNDSARELMGKEKLRELAVVLTERIRENATIDWQIRENVRSKLQVTVKRLLRKYGYPPDMERLATQTVLEQAETIANELSQSCRE